MWPSTDNLREADITLRNVTRQAPAFKVEFSMRLMFNVFKAVFAVSCLAIAACGGNSSADSQSSPNSEATVASDLKAAVPGTASPSGTTIPSATQITDSSGKVWTVAGGVISKNGALAGYSKSVTLLLYDNNVIYEENSAGGWWAWDGSAWVSSSDPRKLSSPSGTTIPSATQITDSSGHIWTVSGGVISENGALAGYSKSVTLLLYDNNILYEENSAGGWWSWNGSAWESSSDPRKLSSPNGTDIPSATQITDSSGHVWTVSGGVIYENGALAGYSKSVTQLLYDNKTIYEENSAGGWWSWNGSAWVSSTDPGNVSVGGAGSASLSWTAPTENTNGTPLTDLAGYTIYYGTSPSELTQTIQLADPSATSYVVANLSAGTYYFAVAAYTTTATQSAQSSAGSTTIQ
jgi:hypothetical protein